jgi:hypothetical protein
MIRFPWVATFKRIKCRCENNKASGYKFYGGRGIKCKITKKELKKLWFRDKAYLLKQPSIDRINPEGDYKYSNCRYIELKENFKRVVHGVALKKLCLNKIKLKHTRIVTANIIPTKPHKNG